ncbi:hypothetical protein CAP48_14380 [Advenella sp. S44]|uniref:alpha/beta fold hydrolase n=1 Tax=Advenella sp. S44 TaxID=1982755 RepID=UPI000C2A1B0D|nr:alpha/beta fold hydrolase [Advenella sp. S44]PJX22130.1 hypothetical protein CAP48_14380 [Advenella sp. S44]
MSNSISHGYINTPDGHQLYYAQFGNIRAATAVVLHGGPGSSSNLAMLDWFDLQRWHVVLIDQRGGGQSLPTGSLEHNTTAHLVADIERVRQHLSISDWTVVGGSWGAYLALAYAVSHARHVRHLVLRGAFVPSRLQLDWFFQDLGALVPQAWHTLTETMTENEKQTVLKTLTSRLLGTDPKAISDAALRWSQYETGIMNSMMQCRAARGTQGDESARQNHANGHDATPGADSSATAQMDSTQDSKKGSRDQSEARSRLIHKYRIQAHYLQHGGFVHLPTLLEQLRTLAVDTTLLHGTHDWICPPANAFLLQQHLRNADMQWIQGGTHTPSDPLVLAALTNTMGRLAGAVGKGPYS